MMTDREKQLAKAALTKMLGPQAPGLSADERRLLAKYPRCTIEQAREIEATGPKMPFDHRLQDLGFVSGFERIVEQEEWSVNLGLGGDHT